MQRRIILSILPALETSMSSQRCTEMFSIIKYFIVIVFMCVNLCVCMCGSWVRSEHRWRYLMLCFTMMGHRHLLRLPRLAAGGCAY